jgi:hypothetical protein
MPTVFRWNISRREQLGRLVDSGPADAVAHILEHVRHCSARVIAMAGNARLVFVGRSPDALYDYLTGAFAGTSWAGRIALLNLSLRGCDTSWDGLPREARSALCDQFRTLALDPAAIVTHAHPVAFVDLICEGETFGKLLDLLFSWAAAGGVDARALRRRLRIVGITEQYVGGGYQSGWKELEWARQFRPGALKGVAIPYWFWTYLGDSEAKASRCNPPERWGDPEMAQPPRDDRHLDGLRRAVALHAAGRTRAERDALAATLSEHPAIRHVWCRVLAAELRRVSRPKRIERTFASKHRVRSRTCRA